MTSAPKCKLVPTDKVCIRRIVGSGTPTSCTVVDLLQGQKVELYRASDNALIDSKTAGGSGEVILSLVGQTLPVNAYFKVYDTDGITLLYTGQSQSVNGGDEFTYGLSSDLLSCDVDLNEELGSGMFKAILDNKGGKFTNPAQFNYYQPVEIWMGDPLTKIFSGMVQKPRRKAAPLQVELQGYDDAYGLTQKRVYAVFTNLDAVSIYQQLVAGTDITWDAANPASLGLVKSIGFQGKNALQCIRALNDQTNVKTFISPDKKLRVLQPGSETVYTATEGSNILEDQTTPDFSEYWNRVDFTGGKIEGRELRVVANDLTGQSSYGVVPLDVWRQEVLDPGEAEQIASNLLTQGSAVKLTGSVTLIGDAAITPLHKLRLVKPSEGIDQQYDVQRVSHRFSSSGFISEVTVFARKAGFILADVIHSGAEVQAAIRRTQATLEALAFIAGLGRITVKNQYPIQWISQDGNIVIDDDLYLTLVSGATSGWFIAGIALPQDPLTAVLLAGASRWRRLQWLSEDRQGSISVDLLNSDYTTRESNVPTPYILEDSPMNRDAWTEGVVNWSAFGDGASVEGSGSSVAGVKSVRGAIASMVDRGIRYTPTKALNVSKYLSLNFRYLSRTTDSFKVRLKVDASNYYEVGITPTAVDKWHEAILLLQASAWTTIGSPSFSSISMIEFFLPSGNNSKVLFVDELYFRRHLLGDVYLKFSLSRASASLAGPRVKAVQAVIDN